MNNMKRYSISGILISVLLVFSIFTLVSLLEVNAVDVISVNAKGYENTIIIEFENESTSKIKTVRMWAGGDTTFTSFKTELGWGGEKQSDDRLLVFTTTNVLNPDESVKFGLTTNEKVNGINWIALDQNGKELDTRKTSIQEISETISSYVEEESKAIIEIKDDGSTLYGTKKFIPETIRADSDIRLIGNGFGYQKNLQLYLDNNIIQTIETDNGGNFVTTISIPETQNVGVSEFLIKDESGNFQSTNINIEESKNRFLKDTKFEIDNIPAKIGYDETLTISGNAYPQSTVVLVFKDNEQVLEKIRVVQTDSNGQWIFEEIVSRTENLGDKFVILKNNQNRVVEKIMIESGGIVEISTAAERYNLGDTISVIGTSGPNKNTTVWIKDENKRTVLYDIVKSDANGDFSFQFVTDDEFAAGTYFIIVKQEDGSDATLIGINRDPAVGVVTLLDKTNFDLNSKAALTIIGPASSKISITIIDSNDGIKISDSITTSSLGKGKYVIDLNDLSSGIYRAVASIQNNQDAIKFSVGVETGSSDISLSTVRENYSQGESILILGQTEANSRLTIALFDPSDSQITKTDIFSDKIGNFSTYDIGIPSNGSNGDWKIIAYSPGSVTQVSKIIHVGTTLVDNLTLQIEGTEFSIGDTVIIKGLGVSETSRLHIKIIHEIDGIIVNLETPLTGDGTFETPWTIPDGVSVGKYTIEVSDNKNADSFEIYVQ
jgi:hypothetical protein